MTKSDLPFGSEFSPTQVQLPMLLELAEQHAGDVAGFQEAILQRYFSSNKTSDKNRRTLAMNAKLGMIAYGIIDRSVNLTDFGRGLHAIRQNESALHQALAKHILLELHGASLVQCVLDMTAAGEEIDLTRLREWLADLGIHFPRGGKHPSMMRLWLERAGVFSSGWQVDSLRFHDLLGVTSTELEGLLTLSAEQQSFVKTLANLEGEGPFASNEIERLATLTYGTRFNEKSLPKSVLYPLRDRGLIQLERGTKEKGRGAKPFEVRRTDRLVKEIVIPLIEQTEKLIGADLRPLLRRSMSEILAELPSEDRHVAGLALEALAFKIMRLVDLDYVATRLRGSATGGAEVDLIFESSRLVFSRWQVQCKNTRSVSLDDVAKEVGLTKLLKSNVIVIVSTGEIGSEARRYANRVMTDSNLCIVMIDHGDVERIKTNPTAIIGVFEREAKHAMQIKRIDY